MKSGIRIDFQITDARPGEAEWFDPRYAVIVDKDNHEDRLPSVPVWADHAAVPSE